MAPNGIENRTAVPGLTARAMAMPLPSWLGSASTVATAALLLVHVKA